MNTNKQGWWLIVVFSMAALVRVPFLSQVGFDDQFFHSWGQKMLDMGLSHVYQAPNIPNYPPIYLYVLDLLTSISQHLFHASPQSQTFITVQKAGNLVVDLVNGGLIIAILRRKHSVEASIGFSLLYLFNPYIMYNSVVWGQVDCLITCAGLSALYFLSKDRLTGTYLSLAMAMLIKVQCIVFLPLVLLYALKRHGWQEQAKPLLIALLFALLVLAPFILNGSLNSLIQEAYLSSSNYFPYLSLNAHNIWWLFSVPTDIFAKRDDLNLGLGFTAKAIGLILFSISYLITLVYVARDKTRDLGRLSLACGAAYLAFYCLNTEMHERYLYAFFGFWLVGTALLNSYRYLAVFAVLSLTQLLSLALMIAAYPWVWQLRFTYFPQITYPLTYLNLACLVLVFYWLIESLNRTKRAA